MTTSAPTALFVVRGSRPVSVEVSGVFDAGAVLGFDAVMNFLVGTADVTIDLAACDVVDEAALQAVATVAQRIVAAGGVVHVVPTHVAPEAAPVPVRSGARLTA